MPLCLARISHQVASQQPPGEKCGLDRRCRVLTALLVVTAIGLAECGGLDESRGRALLVGIDGATLRLVTPLMQEGRLPNLSKIARDGVHGPLRSAQPLHSPRIWNTIATGKVPAKHGILSFSRRDKWGVNRLLLSSDRRVHALWNIVSDAGLTVDVVNWWNTYPPEKIRGVMVSDHVIEREIEGRRVIGQAAPIPTGPVVFPESWHSKLAGLVASGGLPVAFEDPFAGNDRLPEWVEPEPLSRWFLEDAMLTRFALELEAANRPHLLMVLLTGLDRVSHTLWGSIEPDHLYPERLRPSESEREAAATALKRYYEFSDALLGALMARFNDDDLVMVVSDHGFEAGVDRGVLTGVHKSKDAIDGVIFARGRGIPGGGSSGAVTIHDVTPTILAWLGLPVAMDMDGRVAGFAGELAVERVSTYDTGPIERISKERSGAEEKLLEELRGLGYIE